MQVTESPEQFRERVQEKLMEELIDYEEMNNKSASDLNIEVGNENCCNAQSGYEHSLHLILEECPCFKRIQVIMEAFHRLLKDDNLRRSLKMQQVIECDHYGRGARAHVAASERVIFC